MSDADNNKLAKAIEQAKSGIKSDAMTSIWVIGAVASMFLLVGIPIATSAIPSELAKGNQWSWLLLMFPVTGALFLPWLWKMWRAHKLVGDMRLHPDPLPGQIGGQVGGRFVMKTSHAGKPFDLKLSCMRVDRSSDSGDDLLWQAQTDAHHRARMDGEEVVFVFDVPHRDDIRATGGGKRESDFYWVLEAKGNVQNGHKQVAVERRWRLPVVFGTQTSSVSIPTYVREAQAEEALEQAAAQLAVDAPLVTHGDGLTLKSPAGRNKSMWFVFMGVGSLFAIIGVGVLLFAEKSFETMMVGGGFVFMGSLCDVLGVWGYFSAIDVNITVPQVRVVRRLFGRVISEKETKLFQPDQLHVVRTGSSGGTSDTDVGLIYDLQIKHQHQTTTIANNIRGEAAANLLKQRIVTHLFGDQ